MLRGDWHILPVVRLSVEVLLLDNIALIMQMKNQCEAKQIGVYDLRWTGSYVYAIRLW